MSLNHKQKKIGFLLHPRNLNDFYIKYPIARCAPRQFVEWLTRLLPPVVVSKITGLKNIYGKDVEGYVLAVPMTAHAMMENREEARQKIKQAIKRAKKLGIDLLALGGLTASLSRGGLDVVDEHDVGITTGRAYTVKTVTDYVLQLCDNYSIDPVNVVIGVVGAAGSIGKGCALVLAQQGYNNLVLLDREDKLGRIQMDIFGENVNANISITHDFQALKSAHIVIAATNAPEAVIRRRDLSMGTIIINDAQPSDVDDELYDEDDVVIIEGGVVSTPGISCNIDMGLMDSEENFCCAVEAFILAHNDVFDNFSTGHLSIDNIEKLESMSKSFNASLPRYQNIHGYVDSDRINSVATLINERISTS